MSMTYVDSVGITYELFVQQKKLGSEHGLSLGYLGPLDLSKFELWKTSRHHNLD